MRRTRAATACAALLAACAVPLTVAPSAQAAGSAGVAGSAGGAGSTGSATRAAEAAVPSVQAAEIPGFHVAGGRLLDANNQDFVMRGVNHAHTWYPDRTDQALADIKAKGANSVRVVLSTGDQWTKNDTADVAHVVDECKQNRLICVLEAHDTTGYGEAGAATSLSKAVDYWLSVKDAVVGQEKYVLVNIGNEPYGNTNYTAWTADTKAAIGRLRTAGFDHTLMVDAPNWGQDWSFTMRDNAAEVMAADPDRNILFDIHMYGVYDTPAEVSDYLGRYVSAQLAIVVGEFGDMHSDGNPDEDAIMATARSLDLGYLGWSWSGNGGGVEYLDLVQNFDANSPSAWGRRLFDGADGIKATAKEAGVFGDGGGGEEPEEPGEPGTGACAVAYRLHDWGTGFNAEVTVRNTSAKAMEGWQLGFAFRGEERITSIWNAKAAQDGKQVRVTPESWTRTIPAGGSVSFGLSASTTGGTAAPASFQLDGAACATD
ncbi:cellulase family glycosylhydrolase [Streptomyces sp. TRM66268-LWL]|uniref:Endoglucanase n=1 Tax=Streptomyces polyasparticus TaxID=2767826 RepID=A0ABR7S969_9ACTN|nr:cellulase family glycosylhydrolase [Streptomyces polyasparticus]MBC9711482.1 cellulase family glycosylhydrolase [Streptomyces polyasparticus]